MHANQLERRRARQLLAERHHAAVADVDGIAHDRFGLGGNQDDARLGGLSHARGDVYGFTGSAVFGPAIGEQFLGEHFAGIDADAQTDAARFLRRVGDRPLADLAAHVLGGEAGAQGVIFLGIGRAERSHDAVAQHLQHAATVLMDGVDHALQHRQE